MFLIPFKPCVKQEKNNLAFFIGLPTESKYSMDI